jgi:heme-degrading monooxygenase HmoA
MVTVSNQNVMEIATFNIRPGTNELFESAIKQVCDIIGGAEGYVGHILQKCHEVETRYTILIEWRTIEDHVDKFRNSPDAPRCRALYQDYLSQPPVAEHYFAF